MLPAVRFHPQAQRLQAMKPVASCWLDFFGFERNNVMIERVFGTASVDMARALEQLDPDVAGHEFLALVDRRLEHFVSGAKERYAPSGRIRAEPSQMHDFLVHGIAERAVRCEGSCLRAFRDAARFMPTKRFSTYRCVRQRACRRGVQFAHQDAGEFFAVHGTGVPVRT